MSKLAGVNIESYYQPGSHNLRRWWRGLIGKPNQVLFLHGYGHNFQVCELLLNQLANKGYDVYALNAPNHGESEVLNHVSWELLIDIVKEFLDKSDLHNIKLVGFSMGGSWALKVAEAKVEGLSEIVAVAPFPPHTSMRQKTIIAKNFMELARKSSRAQAHFKHRKLGIYRHLFLNYDIASLESKYIKVYALEHDQLFSPELQSRSFTKFPQVKFTVLKGLDHMLFARGNEWMQRRVSKLL